MARMTRGLLSALGALAALTIALPASAGEGASVKGVLVVGFRERGLRQGCQGRRHELRGALPSHPSLDGYAAGDRVQAACLRVAGKLVLAKIRHLTASGGSGSNDAEPTKFAGAVTALSATSISLHDGDRDLTCTIGASSPSTTGVDGRPARQGRVPERRARRARADHRTSRSGFRRRQAEGPDRRWHDQRALDHFGDVPQQRARRHVHAERCVTAARRLSRRRQRQVRLCERRARRDR